MSLRHPCWVAEFCGTSCNSVRSYGLSAAQMTSRWLVYPLCGNKRPYVLFLRKLPHHIRNLINPRAFKEPEDLIHFGRTRLRKRPPQPQPLRGLRARGARRSPSPFRGKGSVSDKSGRRRSLTSGPSRGGRSDRLCFYHSRFGYKAQKCEKGCSYQEN
jgi:hypothetical protein